MGHVIPPQGPYGLLGQLSSVSDKLYGAMNDRDQRNMQLQDRDIAAQDRSRSIADHARDQGFQELQLLMHLADGGLIDPDQIAGRAQQLNLPQIDTGVYKERQSQKKLSSLDEELAGAGDRHADQAIIDLGGRIDRKRIAEYQQRAFDNYMRTRQESGLGSLKPNEQSYAKSFFSSTILKRLKQQDDYDQENRKIDKMGGGSGQDKQNRLLGAVMQRIESNRKERDDWLSSDPTIGMILNRPQMANNPKNAAIFAKEQAFNATHNRLTQAQADLLDGKTPANVSQLLGPPPGQALSTPAVRQPAAAGDDVVNQIVAGISAKQGTLADAKALVGKGLTQEQYNAIAAAINNKAATSRKAPMESVDAGAGLRKRFQAEKDSAKAAKDKKNKDTLFGLLK